jgi:hypothetical protein
MTQNSRRQKVMIAVVLSLFVLVMQAGLMAQNLGTAPQVNVAVQGQQGTQPEGTFLNLINWIGNVIAPVGAGGAALMAIGSFAMGRGFGKWVFTAIGLLMVSGVTRLLEFWIAQGTGGVTWNQRLYGPSSTNHGLHESDAAACAVRSHHLPGASGTQPAARIHSRRVDRGELREMDVLGDRVPHSAATHQLVPFVRSACASAERRHRYGLDGQPPD